MVQQVLAVDKIPVIGTIIWSRDTTRDSNYMKYNRQLGLLKTARTQILNGPDLYHKFEGHTSWYQDDLHPNAEGQDTLRNTWANWALATVYSGNAGNAPRDGRRFLYSKKVFSASVNGKTVTITSAGSGTIKMYGLHGAPAAILRANQNEPVRATLKAPGVYFVTINGAGTIKVFIR